MKAIYNWLGLEYSEDILNYSKNKKYVGKLGDPKGIEKSEKLNQNSLDNWDKLKNEPIGGPLEWVFKLFNFKISKRFWRL